MRRYLCTIMLLLFVIPAGADVLQWQSSLGVSSPADLAISPDGAQLYVANLQGDAIEVLSRVDVTTADVTAGDLTALETKSGEPGLVFPWRVVVSGDGAFVYVITQGSLHPVAPTADALLVFKRGSDGRLTWVETLQNGSSGISAMSLPSDLALSATGDQLYVRASGSNSLLVFNRDAGTGKLSLLQTLLESDVTISGLNSTGWLAVSADAKFVYTTSVADNRVTVFVRNADTKQLSMVKSYVNGSDGVSGLSGAWGVSLSPDQRHLYVIGSNDSSVVAFSRDSVSGLLTFGAAYLQGDSNLTGNTARSFDGLSKPLAVSLSPDGQRVYVSGQEAGIPSAVSTLAVMRRDAVDGSLSFIEVQRSSTATPVPGLDGVIHSALSADGEHLYTAGLSDNNIGVFGHLMADLSLVSAADVNPVEPGATLNYTLKVTNNGEGVANAVVVSDLLPAGVAFIGTDTACNHLNAVLKCELGQLAAGGQVIINVQVTAPLAEGQISNLAMTFSEYNDTSPADNRHQLETTVANLVPNTAPVVADDLATILPGQSLTVNIVANDQDVDGDSLSIISVVKQSDTTQGSLTINSASEVSYTPPAKLNGKDYDGIEHFVYRISDGNGGEAEGLVTIVVNTAPHAEDDVVTVEQGSAVQILVLANDTDADGNVIQVVSVDDSILTGGIVQINDDGSINYTADPIFSGNEIFTYTIEDSNTATATAQVSVEILAATNNSGDAGGGGVDNPQINSNGNSGGGGAVDPFFMMLLSLFFAPIFIRRYSFFNGK